MSWSTVRTGPRGLRLAVHHHGQGGPRPLLLLHGFLECGLALSPLAERLDRACWMPDHRGHGRSEHVGAGGAYHFWDYVGDLGVLIDTLTRGPVDLVGHSMGGTIAAYYAAARPDRVHRLVLLEGLGPPDRRPDALDRARSFLSDRTTPPRHGSFASQAEATTRLRRFNPTMPSPLAEQLTVHLTRPVRPDDPHVHAPQPGRWTWTWDPLHRGRSPTPFDPELFAQHLAAITAPTLLIDGGRSSFVPDDLDARRSALRRAEQQRIDESGHMLHYDAPDRVAAAIAAHLED